MRSRSDHAIVEDETKGGRLMGEGLDDCKVGACTQSNNLRGLTNLELSWHRDSTRLQVGTFLCGALKFRWRHLTYCGTLFLKVLVDAANKYLPCTFN